MAKIVVLGGSFGGLTAALELKRLLGARADVTVISDDDRFVFLPSLPWLIMGWRKPDDITLSVSEILRPKGIEFLHEAAEIVHSHHERFDGSGYPQGLKGEAIPLGARLFAVVDVYDAITSTRPYRTPMSHAAALDLIKQGSGRDFDPQVVEVFTTLTEKELDKSE